MNKSLRFLQILQTVLLGAGLWSGAHAGLIPGVAAPAAAGVGAATTNAFVVNADGTGHVLLLPYFNAQGGNAFVLSLVNTDQINAKAVKLRWRGAANGDSVFSMTVFLAPGDVWNAVVNRNPTTGLAQLLSGDASCTQPAVSAATSFGTARLNPALSAAERAAQTREGQVEIINTADILNSAAAGSLFQSVAGGVRNCAAAAVQATLKDATDEAVASTLGFAGPTGGLRASWTLINVAQTLTYSGSALALQAVDQVTGQSGRGNYMFFPQSEVAVANADSLSADPLLRSAPFASKTANAQTRNYASASLPLVKPVLADFPDLSTPYVNGMATPLAQATHLSNLLALKFLRGDYASDASIQAATDWVLSLPTKRYSVAIDYLQGKPVYSVVTGYNNTEYFSGDNTVVRNGQVCSDQPFRFFDRNAASKTAGDSVSSTSAVISVCGVTTSLQFSAASALGATVTAQALGNRSFDNGWGRIDLSNGYTGIPVIGASFLKASNANAAPGVSGNYGLSNLLKASR